MIKIIANENDKNRKLYKVVQKNANNLPTSKIEKIFRLKDVKVNGKKTNDKHYEVQPGDEILVYGVENAHIEKKVQKTNVTFKKVFENDDILIVDKKPGIAMVGEENCLNNQVLTYLKYEKQSAFMPDSIGRLDKVTSGLVIYAKNYPTLVELKAKHNDFVKTYQFISDFDGDEIITVRLKKDIENQKMTVDKDNKFGTKATTHFFVQQGKKFATLKTGKKHQIRATLEYMGYPILGDVKYGGTKHHRVFLHSYSVTLRNLDKQWEYLNDQEFVSYPKW
ncbi:RluA family pseudouridine synthase [[Mycoplasma] gypis]|uniref:RNA pseudouridylate synthase n=1 Tax=[Mycoplasma] gypis TaxID=92404 RepID=A0ABZ2RNY5_9BACT|nr:RluA family pseudouridine synthase [[Mycoplasma] gypis]MBN0919254.1 RluA family pseudouridine synthase [[Mycoplasma] gypis]